MKANATPGICIGYNQDEKVRHRVAELDSW
jgi:hypothetical protein